MNHLFTLDTLRSNLNILTSLTESISYCSKNGNPYVILKYLEIEHPIAIYLKKLLLNSDYLADSNQLTLTLILATSMLKNAMTLFINGLESNVIVDGYRQGLAYVVDYLYNHAKKKVVTLPSLYDTNNTTIDHNLINTLINNNSNNNNIVTISIEKALSLLSTTKKNNSNNDSWSKRLQSIYLMKSLDDDDYYYDDDDDGNSNGYRINILDGLVLPIYRCSRCKEMLDARVLFFDGDLKRSQSSDLQMELKFTRIEDLLTWQSDEESIYKRWVQQLVQLNVNCLFVSGDIDAVALHYLNLSNILVFRNINDSIFQRLLLNTPATASTVGNDNILVSPIFNMDTPLVSNDFHIGAISSIKEFNSNNIYVNSSNNSGQIISYFHFQQTPTIKSITIMVGENNYRYQDFKKRFDDAIFSLRSIDSGEEERNTQIVETESLENQIYKHILSKIDVSSIRFSLEQYANSFISLEEYQSNYIKNNPKLHSYLKICTVATDIACILSSGNLLQ
ncbi:hypothetical protein PPL_11423 [Heterostelium album PN500]|uniref:Uncharacterized protein n=1 Tax=Heterostelium pallidum (strain ATCC 26659 / Pp 5 / PN500) TaxID=670386 RepID=D3BTC9_HETP5|nr:hypothetical protein PPL_11423 [Heterostelium album PN500]EFA75346.1 hypothetical protein PPL_11423 [Heterostelium album PN500]|eukprot:XP_020427480.1 hypothetical protein PPL_11423 [Heterostelium album PN500]